MARGRISAAIAIAAVLMIAASCGNSPTDTNASNSNNNPSGGSGAPGTTASPSDLKKNVPITADGVTDTEIHVGGVASTTNVLQAEYDQAFKGTQAYFDMINSQGGIYGRKLVLDSQRDDRMTGNSNEVQGLISQDKVFAVLPVATLLFTGAQSLTDAKVPTFGWNINDEWAHSPYLFGEKGSYLCADCGYPTLPWVSQKIGAKKVGLLAYGSQAQSKQCADGDKKAFDKWGGDSKIVFEDSSIEFGATDLSVPVSKMKDAGVDFIITCVDTNGAITLAKEMQKQGLKATQYLPNGYDYDLLSKFGDVMEGSLVGIGFTPFESPQPSAGMKEYLEWIQKVPGAKKGELTMAGWMSAQLFVEGLKQAGPEFSRDKLVSAINSMTDWDANGLGAGVNWTIEHEQSAPDSCSAFVKVQNKQFVPQFGEPGKPFICLHNDSATLPANPELKG